MRRSAAGCRDHLCPRRTIGAGGAARGAQGRQSGVRGNPYERHSELSLSSALGGTTIGVGRQPHAPGRARFLKIASQAGIRTETTAFPLSDANDVLTRLRTGQILGDRRRPSAGKRMTTSPTASNQMQERVFAFLADPVQHPEMHRIDTHAASVFLVGDRALKIKRAVRFPISNIRPWRSGRPPAKTNSLSAAPSHRKFTAASFRSRKARMDRSRSTVMARRSNTRWR